MDIKKPLDDKANQISSLKCEFCDAHHYKMYDASFHRVNYVPFVFMYHEDVVASIFYFMNFKNVLF